MTTQSGSGYKEKVIPYGNFMGIDAVRDPAAIDSGENQYLVELNNGFADWRGMIYRDPGAFQRIQTGNPVTHVAFLNRELAVYARLDGAQTTITTERNHDAKIALQRGSNISTTVFNNKLIVASAGYDFQIYNGYVWKLPSTKTNIKPAFVTTCQRRLIAAGFPTERTRIEFSRVDDENYFSAEDVQSSEVTKGVYMDVGNIIGTAETVTGLATLEQNRLAIFTEERALIYVMDPDYTKWTLEDRSQTRVGTYSHNTIVQAGNDLIFASRSGIHTIRRSANGLSLTNVAMSHQVELLYRALLRSVPDPETITAYYDSEYRQYHLFFPQTELYTRRLTMTISPSENVPPKFSTGTFINARCGAQLGGVTALGTPGGVFQLTQIEDYADVEPECILSTPVLYFGSLYQTKESASIIVQASGTGEMVIDAEDQVGRKLSSIVFEIEMDGEDDKFVDLPLNLQYERKFEHRFLGLKLRFTLRGKGLIRLSSFAVKFRG